ncbi:zinc-binding dehydrogenase [Streptomyces sp. TS71-3]|uniref:zinc-binding dehydrogenase n=1 Tax=Streptomyces sp. TS71-3 TaxID=2733862 RepID=UPI001B2C13FA|nr:zinc-binding dehydrogenase [Streptomyces sp. TS71-3]GHJ40898.1 alcohol dehydrogenase [Streptomyces sp. TS71-3]
MTDRNSLGGPGTPAPRTVRAAVLRRAGEPLGVEDVLLDAPLAGEVLVRIDAAGVCHTDLHYMAGDLSSRLPAVIGHEGTGVVEAVGEGVTLVAAGQRVCLLWRPRCGECRYCVTGAPAMCERAAVQAAYGGLLDGTSRLRLPDGGALHHLMGASCFARYAVVSERAVVAVPDGVPAEVAAVAGCAVITGVGAVLNAVGGCAGASLAVFGAGGVGLSAVMGARLAGAFPVIAVDVVAERLDTAVELGATHVVDASRRDVAAELRRLVPGGLDHAIEAIGRPDVLAIAFDALRPRGQLVPIGLSRPDTALSVPLNQVVQHEKRIVGSLYGSSNPVVDLPRLFALHAAGRLPLDRLVGRTYPLEQINDACDDLGRGAVGRGVVLPWAA